jgi:hypothetical protein
VKPTQLNLSPHKTASPPLRRALTLLFRACKEISSAIRVAPDEYHRQCLHCLAAEVKDLSLPLARVAARIAKQNHDYFIGSGHEEGHDQ